MAIKYDISAKTGTYTDSSGQEKGRYFKMGVVVETHNGGLMMKIDGTPLNWDGFAYLNTPKDHTDKPTSDSSTTDTDTIPF